MKEREKSVLARMHSWYQFGYVPCIVFRGAVLRGG